MRKVVVGPLLAASALSLCGCTLIGFLIGREVDNGKPRAATTVARSEIETVKVGSQVEVQLWDGRTLAGKYLGIEWVEPAAYGPSYEAARRTLGPDVALPALGAGARLVLTDGKHGAGAFVGAGPGFVRFTEAGFPESSFQTHRIASLADASGRAISGPALDKLLLERRLPALTRLKLKVGSSSQLVDHTEVASLRRLDKPNSGRKTGTIIGLVADAVIVGVAIHSLQNMEIFPESTCRTSDPYCTSCPLIDSWDGRGWVLDAEPLGGAFHRGGERTDVARLDRLVEHEGRYRLRLRNDMNEIDHVDSLALRVVDHPAGVEIVPDALGRVHAVRDARPPTAARSLSASEGERRGGLTTRLAAADGDAWASDAGEGIPFPQEPRDGVELQFLRPSGATSAVLVARVGANPVGPRLLTEVLALHGRDVGRFYATLETQPAARAAFESAREREVLPTIRVFDANEWRTAGHLQDLPLLIRRDQAVKLDLRGVVGETLRLRIDGIAGLFSIDRAVVSFEGEAPIEETRVTATRATDDTGRDVLDLLRRTDGRRHSLRPHLDAATLDFAAPPRRIGQARTVLVEATGYYNVILRADGEPQPLLFRRLIEEPGAVARFALRHLPQRNP